MRITTISLRNYRVYKSLDLELPPGLVGIYGANGSGKSSLLESIGWALYGRARTGKGEIRTSGESGECAVELGFEHESNHYLVRRSLSGKNATVKARVMLGDAVVADGVTDVAKYLQSVLGLDELAFRSSVFAEQKQLAAFSDQSPDQRRKLVLQLLGITPIEKARDEARADARQRQKEHASLQTILGSLTESEERAERASAEEALAVESVRTASLPLEGAETRHELAKLHHQQLLSGHVQAEQIKAQGQTVRKRRDALVLHRERLQEELRDINSAADELSTLPPATDRDVAAVESRLALVAAWEAAVDALRGVNVPAESLEEPDPEKRNEVETAKNAAAEEVASSKALLEAVRERVSAAKEAVATKALLLATDSCPLCGQELGSGFDDVQRHAQSELEALEAEAGDRQRQLATAETLLRARQTELKAAEAFLLAEQRSFASYRKVVEQRDLAQASVARALGALDPAPQADESVELRGRRAQLHAARTQRAQLVERTTRRTTVEDQLGELSNELLAVELERTTLLESLRSLAIDSTAVAAAAEELRSAADAFVQLRAVHDHARLHAARAAQSSDDAKLSLKEAQERQAALADVEGHARYLGRTADLLSGFRQAIVAMVGPQLSAHASSLFNELTGNEYDGLQIDPETYAIEVIDGGVAYPSERFSGSEVDLANLALRVSISEQIRFQAGGQIGLLVLDEALASLDTDRKDQMLAALRKLSGRFRQIIVVTHSADVKQQLPEAIEVRRAGNKGSQAILVDPRPN